MVASSQQRERSLGVTDELKSIHGLNEENWRDLTPRTTKAWRWKRLPLDGVMFLLRLWLVRLCLLLSIRAARQRSVPGMCRAG